MLESNVQKIFMDKLKKSYPNSWVEKITVSSIPGSPDLLFIVDGIVFRIECKRNDKIELTEKQKYKLDQLRKAGALCFIVNAQNINDVLKDIEEIVCQKKRFQKKI